MVSELVYDSFFLFLYLHTLQNKYFKTLKPPRHKKVDTCISGSCRSCTYPIKLIRGRVVGGNVGHNAPHVHYWSLLCALCNNGNGDVIKNAKIRAKRMFGLLFHK